MLTLLGAALFEVGGRGLKSPSRPQLRERSRELNKATNMPVTSGHTTRGEQQHMIKMCLKTFNSRALVALCRARAWLRCTGASCFSKSALHASEVQMKRETHWADAVQTKIETHRPVAAHIQRLAWLRRAAVAVGGGRLQQSAPVGQVRALQLRHQLLRFSLCAPVVVTQGLTAGVWNLRYDAAERVG